jgi:hypothetical protein
MAELTPAQIVRLDGLLRRGVAYRTALAFSDVVTQDQLDALVLSGGGAVASVAGKTGVVSLVKADVGLGNVDNTSDSSKPISSAQQAALDLKAALASPAFTGTPTGITKAHVGLSSVDNTSDAGKPVSTAQQTALNAKAPLVSPAFTGTPTGITKAHVGLGNVDNTSDATKQAAFDLRYVRTVNGTAPDGAGNVVVSGGGGGVTFGTSAGTAAEGNDSRILGAAQKSANLSDLVNAATARTNLGLGNVSNTADSAKPVSTAQQAALDAKAPLASPAFTGTPTGITKTHVGLGNVDNTADSAKPVSTAQAAADTAATAAAQATSLQKTSNLSDVASAATARTNLGLGSAATSPTSAFEPAGAAASAASGVLPAQAGQAGKFLQTNGSVASWGTPAGGGGGALEFPAPSYAGTRTKPYLGTLSAYNKRPANERQLQGALARANAGLDTADILFLGDSNFSGVGVGLAAAVPAQVYNLMLQSGLPGAGSGMLYFRQIISQGDPRITAAGTWTADTAMGAQSSTAGATVGFGSTGKGTAVEIWFDDSSCNFDVLVDGIAPANGVPVLSAGTYSGGTVTPGGTSTVQRFAVTGLADSTHTVQVTRSSGASTPIRVTAVDVYRATGVRIQNASITGFRIDSFLSDAAATPGWAVRRTVPAPDAVFIHLGGNDFLQARTPAQALSDMTALIATFKALPSNPDIFICAPSPGTGNATALQAIVSALYDAADSADSQLIDFQDLHGTVTEMDARGMLQADDVHLTTAGHLANARVIDRVIAGKGLSQASAATSSGGKPIVFREVLRSGGSDLTIPASWAALDTTGALDVTIPAVVGDVILVGLNALSNNAAVHGRLDAATLSSGGALVNYVSSGNNVQKLYGVNGWTAIQSLFTAIGPARAYTVKAEDLVGGNVTFRLIGKTDTSTAKIIYATANYNFSFSAQNIGPQS